MFVAGVGLSFAARVLRLSSVPPVLRQPRQTLWSMIKAIDEAGRFTLPSSSSQPLILAHRPILFFFFFFT